MELRCEDVVAGLGCEFVASGTTIEETQAAMMAHGGEVHANLMDGKSPEEMAKAGAEMAAHIHQLLGGEA